MKKLALVMIGVAAGAAFTAAPASAHAVLSRSTPPRGASVDSVPAEIAMRFTEPPTTDANVVVTDGCRRDVVGGIEVLNAKLTATIANGQPGRWRVRYELVSAVDGHPTSGSFSFRVQGDKNCDEAPPTIAGGDRTRNDDDGGSLIPWLIGSGLVIVAAIVGSTWLRRAVDRD